MKTTDKKSAAEAAGTESFDFISRDTLMHIIGGWLLWTGQSLFLE